VTSSSTAEWGTGRTAAAARDGWGSGEKRARAKGKKEKMGVGGWGDGYERMDAVRGGRRRTARAATGLARGQRSVDETKKKKNADEQATTKEERERKK